MRNNASNRRSTKTLRSTGTLFHGGVYEYDPATVLDSGSFGKVYRCTNPRNLAIKVIDLSKYRLLNHNLIRYLKNEIKLHSEITSTKPKYVLPVVDYTPISALDQETQQQCFIVTRLCQGGTLLQFIKCKPGITELAPLLLQAARGINEMHEKGIIHRDIKPANILLDESKKVFIIDFGLVTQQQKFRGSMVGTPFFTPPEIARTRESQRQKVDCLKIDVFAFGKTIQQLLKNCRKDDISLFEQCSKLSKKCCQINPVKRPVIKTVILELQEMVLWEKLRDQLFIIQKGRSQGRKTILQIKGLLVQLLDYLPKN